MQALDFLRAVQGVAQAALSPGHKLATIDPAYNASTTYPDVELPKVTFDGESTLSTKRYPIVTGYVPAAGDRVVMAPVGRTYVILGAVSHATGEWSPSPGLIAKHRITTPSATYGPSSTTDFAISDLTVSGARDYRIHLNSPWFINAAGSWHCFIRIDGVDHARIGAITSLSAGTTDEVLSGSVIWQPATGTYDIGVYAHENVIGSDVTFHADATSPRELWVEDIGWRR